VILPVVLFIVGVLTGALAFMLYAMLSKDPLIVRQLGSQGADVAQIRQAAREGTLDAIATLQAGGGTQSSPPPPVSPTPTQLPKDAFALRDANRLGKPEAPVTIVEYSDFQ
jgi:protein-disulfide isomerase